MVEPFEHVVLQEFITHAVVQGLHEPVMPRLAGRDECLERVVLAGPAPHGCGGEFRPVIGAQRLGCSMGSGSQVKHFDHVGRSHAPLDAESQVLARELIDEVTDLEYASLPVRVELEIDGPHLPRSTSLDQALEAWRSAGLGGLARAHAQPLGAPQAPERITPHDDALALGPRPGAFIAPASMRGGKIVHPLAHRPMITQRFRPAGRAGPAIR